MTSTEFNIIMLENLTFLQKEIKFPVSCCSPNRYYYYFCNMDRKLFSFVYLLYFFTILFFSFLPSFSNNFLNFLINKNFSEDRGHLAYNVGPATKSGPHAPRPARDIPLH